MRAVMEALYLYATARTSGRLCYAAASSARRQGRFSATGVSVQSVPAPLTPRTAVLLAGGYRGALHRARARGCTVDRAAAWLLRLRHRELVGGHDQRDRRVRRGAVLGACTAG